MRVPRTTCQKPSKLFQILLHSTMMISQTGIKSFKNLSKKETNSKDNSPRLENLLASQETPIYALMMETSLKLPERARKQVWVLIKVILQDHLYSIKFLRGESLDKAIMPLVSLILTMLVILLNFNIWYLLEMIWDSQIKHSLTSKWSWEHTRMWRNTTLTELGASLQ